MSDYERYGDYNEIDEAPGGKSKNPVVIILKAVIALVCISVVGILAFRMVLFNSYPDGAKRLYFNDTLTAYYESTDGEIGAKTQELRFPYDDEDLGNFFCDYLVVIEGAEQIQISVRYNTASLARLAEEAGLESISPDDMNAFEYRLCDNYGRVYGTYEIASFDTQVMYRYTRLVFDGVDVTPDESGVFPEWIRLEIVAKGATTDAVYMVPMYENNEDYSLFTEYTLSREERPNEQ